MWLQGSVFGGQRQNLLRFGKHDTDESRLRL